MAPPGAICRSSQQVKFVIMKPTLGFSFGPEEATVSMEALQRYPGSLLLQLAEVAAANAGPCASSLEVNIDRGDLGALRMAINVHRTGSVFGGPLPSSRILQADPAPDPRRLLRWLEQDVLATFNLPPLHELDIAVGEAECGSLQPLLKAYQVAAVESVVQAVLKLLPKGPSPSMLLRKRRTAFAIVPEQADSPFRLTVFRLEVDYPETYFVNQVNLECSL